VIAFGSGGVLALALPPLHLWPALLGFALLLHLIRRAPGPGRVFLLGWWFGFGHFLAGLYWIAIAFFTDAERFGALAVPAVILLAAFMAFYPAIAATLTRLVPWRSPVAAALVFAVAWTAAEMLRGVLFGGFPWNLIGYVFVSSTAMSQLAAVTGVYGLSLLAVVAGAVPVVLLDPTASPRWRPLALIVALLAIVWSGGALRLASIEAADFPDLRLRLVQANIAQHHKWDPKLRARWFRRHLELSLRDPDAVSHVIWPESAVPYQLEPDPELRRLAARAAPKGGYLLTGGDRFDLADDPPKAWNSLFVLDENGEIRARYDKRDLVPFGEFLPMRDLLGRLGLEKLTAGSIDFQPGPGRLSIALPGLPPFSPLICYESIFAGRVTDPGARPAWLLNITNDAWFGRSSGPYQHFAMARLRAIEEGLPLVRAANTGISAVIDPVGRIRAYLGLGETGVVDAALPKPLGEPTLFARWRQLPRMLLLATLLVAGLFERHIRSLGRV